MHQLPSNLTEVLVRSGLQRLMRDFKRLQQDPPQGINGSPNPDNIMSWNAVIFGPDDTPWDGGEQPTLPARSMMLQTAVAVAQQHGVATVHEHATLRIVSTQATDRVQAPSS